LSDDSDPEPGGWSRLAAIVHNTLSLDIDVVPVKLGAKKLSTYKLLHLTGTKAFSLTPKDRAQLSDYVQSGGTLVVDAAGGRAEFADAASTELRAIFGRAFDEAAAQPLDLSDPLFNISGEKIASIGYRDWLRRRAVGILKAPRLIGIRSEGRIVAYFSREDLSAGLVGEPIDGVAGYTPETATAIMRNIVLNTAFRRHTPPAPTGNAP
jgi:hypothetical protein